MKRTLLVDADIVAYKFASANEETYLWDGPEGELSVASDENHAKEAATEYLAELKGKLGATDIVICLSDPSNRYFRHDVDSTYKASRKAIRKPELLMVLKNWFKEAYQTYQRPALEADDCMGILSTHPTLIRGEKIIVSEDKDMAGVPGLLFNPRKDKKPRKIGKLAASKFHLIQTITGDATDGYPGAPGIGPKSPEVAAVEASRTVAEAWGHVLAAFTRARWKDDPDAAAIASRAVVQARLARILWASDWDFPAKKPRLWLPPS